MVLVGGGAYRLPLLLIRLPGHDGSSLFAARRPSFAFRLIGLRT
jgi:hypothetical protein